MTTGEDPDVVADAPRTVVLRDDDPAVVGLLADGFVVVAESWGARLHVRHDTDLEPARRALAHVAALGVSCAELGPEHDEAVVALDALTGPDYPRTPATPHEPLTAAGLADARAQGGTVVGATHPEHGMVGATVLAQDGDRAETDRTSVHPGWRCRGVASAVKAASVLALARRGVREFATGGAQVNTASLRMNARVGYVVTERWLSLSRA